MWDVLRVRKLSYLALSCVIRISRRRCVSQMWMEGRLLVLCPRRFGGMSDTGLGAFRISRESSRAEPICHEPFVRRGRTVPAWRAWRAPRAWAARATTTPTTSGPAAGARAERGGQARAAGGRPGEREGRASPSVRNRIKRNAKNRKSPRLECHVELELELS